MRRILTTLFYLGIFAAPAAADVVIDLEISDTGQRWDNFYEFGETFQSDRWTITGPDFPPLAGESGNLIL